MIRHQDPCEHLRITEQGLAFETRGGYTGGGKVHEEWDAAPSRNRQVVDLMRQRYAAATQGTMSGARIHADMIGRDRGAHRDLGHIGPGRAQGALLQAWTRSEEHTSELQSLMRI